jgi:heme-degrading monooxygenase HmoA
MIIQMVKFETKLPFEDVLNVAQGRAPQFRKIPGLIQKYYVRTSRPNQYAGVYIWGSPDSMKKYRESDLAASIPQAYKVLSPPAIEVYEVAFTQLTRLLR